MTSRCKEICLFLMKLEEKSHEKLLNKSHHTYQICNEQLGGESCLMRVHSQQIQATQQK